MKTRCAGRKRSSCSGAETPLIEPPQSTWVSCKTEHCFKNVDSLATRCDFRVANGCANRARIAREMDMQLLSTQGMPVAGRAAAWGELYASHMSLCEFTPQAD